MNPSQKNYLRYPIPASDMDKEQQFTCYAFSATGKAYLFLGGLVMDFIMETIMYFHKGGLVMWPLLFCSFTVLLLLLSVLCFIRLRIPAKSLKTITAIAEPK